MEKKYGFITPTIKDTDYLFGSGQIDTPILRLDGQWDDVIPEDEKQNLFTETYNCTGFGTNNQKSFYMRAKFGEDENNSDRFTGIVAGTKYPGNDPNIVLEAVRKNGFIPEAMLPFSKDIDTEDEYFSFKGADEYECRKKGFDWVKKYTLKHDWVHSNKSVKADPERIKNALKYSPLGVAVNAWNFGAYFYVREGEDNHWCVMYGYEDNKYWKIFDSYDNTKKQLAWDYGFYYIKRIAIEKQATPEQISVFQQISNKLAQIGQLLWEWAQKIVELPSKPIETPIPEITPVEPIKDEKPNLPPPNPIITPYLWDTPQKACHSFRVICDEENLSVDSKNLLAQVLNCESGFKISAINRNENGTTDWGICQYNDYFYIGKDRAIKSVDEALNNPERCVRVFIKEYKAGRLKNWVCYSKKMYLNYPIKVV